MKNSPTLFNEDKISNIKQVCTGLQSLDRKIRKQTFANLEKYLSAKENEFSNQELRTIFVDIHIYVLNGLRDKTESVREQAIKFIKYFLIDKLPLNDYYLTYVFPVLVERLGSVEIIEESEEIRLQLLQLLEDIISKYNNTAQLVPFLNDSIIILSETVKDKYPVIKELSCRTIIHLANALPKDFHKQAESLIKPVLTCFSHQRYKVRVEAIQAIGEIVMHSSYKALDEAVGPLAEKLFDQIPIVRRAVGQVAARWLLEYRDRYSFFHKILPLLLTGLNDEVLETRMEAAELWEKVGMQYQNENEKDFKEESDYLIKPPKYYPINVKRPNLGCRGLVKRNICKIAPGIARELMSWQEDVRLRCAQLLCALALHAEEGITQNLQDLFLSMYSAAKDDDPRVVNNIECASEIIGCFVKSNVWSDLMLPIIEDGPHYGHLTVLQGLVKGAPTEYLDGYIENICTILARDSICCSRKDKYQVELIKCLRVLSEKYQKDTDESIGFCLFKIAVSVFSLKHPDNLNKISDADILEELRKSLHLQSIQQLWKLYSPKLLNHVNKNPSLWVTVTEEECIFLFILTNMEEAFGENLEIIKDILVQALDIDCDCESRLKILYVLATLFEKKDIIFGTQRDVSGFLEKLVQDIFVPSLIWRAGATCEAIRTMAASCLQSALLPTDGVEIFSADSLPPVVEDLLPLLVSLLDDPSYRSRQIAVECLTLLKENCRRKNIWTLEYLTKIYPEILKRLDDPTDKVRMSALRNLPFLFKDVPENFKNSTFKAHHELIIDTLLIHFDDEEESVQKLVKDVLEEVAKINKKELLNKLERHKSLLRNQKGCEDLIESLGDLKITAIVDS
ncbi:dynein axonemal assembly factor 5 isoform X1 [Diorhabda sublineata]|uniref:dynein axonemal assembly factor 5 isoform X1 n=1 Tax=Diorhabda sublineata TaxID=1163346 RepID=UPI0024E10F0F|nr:dynein axonemal assembly factor 5 isoform X1 [Diorhabda sublineata]